MSEKSPYTEFLTPSEVIVLTGYKAKSKQVEHLRMQGIPFKLNGRNEPIVLRQILLGHKQRHSNDDQIKQRWQSPVLSKTS